MVYFEIDDDECDIERPLNGLTIVTSSSSRLCIESETKACNDEIGHDTITPLQSYRNLYEHKSCNDETETDIRTSIHLINSLRNLEENKTDSVNGGHVAESNFKRRPLNESIELSSPLHSPSTSRIIQQEVENDESSDSKVPLNHNSSNQSTAAIHFEDLSSIIHSWYPNESILCGCIPLCRIVSFLLWLYLIVSSAIWVMNDYVCTVSSKQADCPICFFTRTHFICHNLYFPKKKEGMKIAVSISLIISSIFIFYSLFHLRPLPLTYTYSRQQGLHGCLSAAYSIYHGISCGVAAFVATILALLWFIPLKDLIDGNCES